MERQEIRIDFKTIDRDKVMADMISEKSAVIQQLIGEVQKRREENEDLKARNKELETKPA
jgi:hypothetical protein